MNIESKTNPSLTENACSVSVENLCVEDTFQGNVDTVLVTLDAPISYNFNTTWELMQSNQFSVTQCAESQLSLMSCFTNINGIKEFKKFFVSPQPPVDLLRNYLYIKKFQQVLPLWGK